jgi:hypothetical protein
MLVLEKASIKNIEAQRTKKDANTVHHCPAGVIVNINTQLRGNAERSSKILFAFGRLPSSVSRPTEHLIGNHPREKLFSVAF